MASTKKSFTTLALILACIVLPACWTDKKAPEKKKGLLVLNVLDKDLYNDCHIQGSEHMPLEKLEEYASSLDYGSEIVVYCSNYRCSTSGFVCKQLKKMAFENVWAYEGGTAEWYQMGLPVEGPSKSAYLTKKITPPEHTDNEVPLITAQELARKLQIEILPANPLG